MKYVVLALALAGCSPAVAPVAFPAPVVPGFVPRGDDVLPPAPAELIASARAWEAATGDFSALVSVRMVDAAHGMDFRGEGGLAVKRPDRMRMQLTGPGGVTVFDLLARDGRYWFRVPGRPTVQGSLDDRAPAMGVPAPMIARMVLGLDWRDARLAHEGPSPVVRLSDPRGVLFVTLGPADKALQELRWFERDPNGALHEWARTRFTFTDADANTSSGTTGRAHPDTVWFEQASPHVQTTLSVRSRTVHPDLPARTFEAFE